MDEGLPAARGRILDAAERLFAEHGFSATPTARIAALAEVPKGLLFYYFPAKADILRALIGERLHFAPIDTATLITPGDPERSLLNVTAKLAEAQAASNVSRIIVWREQRTHPEVRASLLEYRTRMQATIEQVLRESMPSPVPARRIRAAAQAWLGILTSQPVPGHADTETPVHENLAELAELICDGMRTAVPA